MPTVTIRIDEETDARLKHRLARSGETLSEFVREALARHLDAQPRIESRLTSLTRALADVRDTGETDASTTYKARIQERLRGKHHR
jgi:Arc/MetJ-type ribon-helix-helix transcriptional regulator